MAREQIIDLSWDEVSRTMTFNVRGAGTLKLDTRKMSGAAREKAFIFGIGQKVSNAAAKSRVIRNGVELNATPTGKFNSMKRVVEYLETGADGWNPGRDPDRIGVDESLLSQAMVLAFPSRSAEEIRAKVVSSTKEQRKALSLDARIAPHYEKLMAEYTADVDTEELLAGW
jgi:hypothetical protein